MKKIYRIYAHDTTENYPEYSAFYITEQSREEFIASLLKDHEGTIVIDCIAEYTVEDVVNLLNLYIE
jgi:hypothetical protein